MKKLDLFDLIALKGGTGETEDCMRELQEEAGFHQNTGDREADDEYWDYWADRFFECLGDDI